MEDVRRHNQAVLDSLVPGDLVEFQRSWLFSHWAVYIGGVFSSSSERSMTGVVRRDSFWTVAGRSKAFKNNRRDAKYSCDVIVTRALSKLGVSEFNLFLRNSEHFVAWCRYGEECSEQAQTIWTMFLGSMAVIVGGIAALTGLRR